MKTSIRAKKVNKQQGDISLYFVELESELPQMWISIKSKHKVEEDAIIDNINEYLTYVCEDKLAESAVYYEQDWKAVKFTKGKLATFIMKCFAEALDRISSEDKDAFVSYVTEAKDVVKEYLRKYQADIVRAKEIEEEKNKKPQTEEIIPNAVPSAEIDYDYLADLIVSRMPVPVQSWSTEVNVPRQSVPTKKAVATDKNVGTKSTVKQIELWGMKMTVAGIDTSKYQNIKKKNLSKKK